ncbi:MAG: ABC transporter permease [Gemmatimonadetes bacterium]|jgi:peptide/nickel transport system permease protein|nr:ABC transporter permease [Gemmatimonadota bacterium]MDE0963181.1 ABC transporter permease [Candidatus Latescibacterota bacterium]MBT5328637.1 ABC transporter permease [Gemmatimonadota bacterium]MBT5451242.1 ABC transporter permease [Gemmatimonadota bacterium]MBT5805452.1 ABC transporter permease [Gemmatimonadota bacterium]|tara:strand:- start:103 stop:1086 length:984 start_codon:yes stop_codon:yes gene_type:complete
MLNYIIRRVLLMIPTLVAISVLIFIIIQLPPGDIITSRLQELQAEGQDISEEQIEALRARYNLNDPLHIQYFKWIGGILVGNMGYSVMYGQSVNNLIWERLGFTLLITFSATLLTWLIAFPVGVYSALRQYSVLDYAATLMAFVGLATPNFLLALVLMYLGYEWFGIAVGGLFSPEYASADWSMGKLGDLLAHLWIPAVVIGMGGTAGMVRIMRANLLDELGKPYVTTALAKGLHPIRLVIKYPLRIALNPFISTVGWMLPHLISGAAIIAVVLSLPTTGPLLLDSLKNQDMYLAGSFLLMLSALTVIGTLLSDILLAITDPRIRYE